MLDFCGFKIRGEHEKGDGILLLANELTYSAHPWWHISTRRCLEALTEADVKGKRVLDFGCGAAPILGLAASSLGAREVAYAEKIPALWEHAKKTIEANDLPPLEDDGGTYDFILANIGDAYLLGQISKRSTHGIGTEGYEVMRW
jgi:ribosomal protein L11 methylase PrmA